VKKLRTHYDNLKVSRDAPPEVIRMAYKALVTKYHPDRNPNCNNSLRTMQAINASYEILTNDEKRRQHDQWISDRERLALPSPGSNMPTRPSSEWDESPGNPPPVPVRRSGCRDVFGAVFVRVIILGALCFATVQTLLHWPSEDLKPASSPLVKPTPVPMASRQPARASSGSGPAVAQIHWDTKDYIVRADRAVEIRKKVDVAWSYVSEYIKLKEEKSALEKRLSGTVFSRSQIQQRIDALDAQMKKLDASAQGVIRTIEADIREAAPGGAEADQQVPP
jgi:hypothetical protein